MEGEDHAGARDRVDDGEDEGRVVDDEAVLGAVELESEQTVLLDTTPDLALAPLLTEVRVEPAEGEDAIGMIAHRLGDVGVAGGGLVPQVGRLQPGERFTDARPVHESEQLLDREAVAAL